MTDASVIEQALRLYPDLGSGLRWASLGNRGGFSGARIFRITSSLGDFCLKAYPQSGMTTERLSWIHRLMRIARDSGLLFVPAVLPLHTGIKHQELSEQLWEVIEWMPGVADFTANPSRERLAAACEALARLHLAWKPAQPQFGACPAIERRLDAASLLSSWLRNGWKPRIEELGGPLQPLVDRAWRTLQSRDGWIQVALEPFRSKTWMLQPCLCDIWHDHVLFDGDRVTAIIDYGGVKVDHVAVDLARLLGSLIGDDQEKRKIGMHAYAQINAISDEERQLASALDTTGTLVALITWLRWICHEHRQFADTNIVSKRIKGLIQRCEGL